MARSTLLLLLPGLDLPIRDWDEGIVARVAYERGQALLQFSQGELSWHELLLPTYWAEPYLNKPPGLHLPAGLALLPWASSGDLPPPWAVRLVPALLASAVVPLAGLITRQLNHKQQGAAIAAAAIALTLAAADAPWPAGHARWRLGERFRVAVVATVSKPPLQRLAVAGLRI